MATLKQQQKKLLRDEVTNKVMDYLAGLDDRHEAMIRKMATSYNRKIIKAYLKAIKFQQHENQ
jgi:hypothetical protein